MRDKSFLPRLLSVCFSSDAVWEGEKLYIKTTWQNQEGVMDFAGKICLDFEMDHFQRQREIYYDLSFKYKPYPQCFHWQPGVVYTVGGIYTVPNVLGGPRDVYLTLLDDDNMPVPFIGRENKKVCREHVGRIQFTWGRPSEHTISLLRPFCTLLNQAADPEEIVIPDSFCIGETDFCCDYPGLFAYAGEFLYPYKPRIMLRSIAENSIYSASYSSTVIKKTSDEVRYHLCGENFAADIVYYIENSQVVFRLENVNESENMELISVDYPHFLALGGEKNHLVHFYGIGGLVDAHRTWQMGCEFPWNSEKFSGVYNENICVALTAESLDTVLSDSIEGTENTPLAVLGAKLHYKAASSQKGKSSLPVKADISIKLQFEKVCADVKCDWQTMAKMLRSRLTPKYDNIYKGAFVGKWMLDDGSGRPEGRHSPDEFREHVRMLSSLTDNLPMILYLVGWQKGGHDFGYPVPYELNECFSSEQVLRDLVKECREKYNTVVSFHDNFDDAYFEYDFDHSLVAQDQYGQPYKGWIWGGGQSYIISPKRYSQSGAMAERVRHQVEFLGISGSYHIDVLTAEIQRYDYSPDMMAAADENFEYKKAVIKEFEKYGVDVSSEVLTYPSLGNMSFAWHMRAGAAVYKDEERIPLYPLLCHGLAGYNMPSSCDEEKILDAMICGGQSVIPDMMGYNEEQIFALYILSIPIIRFAEMEIERYEFEGDKLRAVYGSDSFVEVNYKEKTYTIQLNGRVIGKDWVTKIQTKPDTVLVYARNAGSYSCDLPEGWQKITAVCLTPDGEADPVDAVIAGHTISVTVPAGVPVKIRRI